MTLTKKLLLFLFIFVLASCSDTESTGIGAGSGESATEVVQSGTERESESRAARPGAGGQRLSMEQIHEELDVPVLTRSWTGDLDGMEERRVIRVLTVYGLGTYYIDHGQERGIVYELFRMFEEQVNRRAGKKHVKIHLIFIPVARDELIPGLIEGRGDIAAAGLTITLEREELVDFTDPITHELSEVLVTGPSAPTVSSLHDLAGRDMYVRASSSYHASLEALNLRFLEEGLAPINILDVSELLEDEDILELVSNGSLDWTVVDDYKAKIWTGVFESLVVREDIVFREGGQLGYAIRKNSPQLMAALNEFMNSHRQGTLQGNILVNRHFKDFDWAHNALGKDDYDRFLEVAGVFEKYGEQYGFDYLMVVAQGYQESRLQQSARSAAGAIGIMQLLPATAADPNVGIPDIFDKENNIHAGVKYLEFIRSRYFDDPGMDALDQTFFALAAYNAGPARIADLRRKAEQQGYDPNVWFNNVEIIAARDIGGETVTYVANILKYYMVYRLSLVRALQRLEMRQSQDLG